MHKFPFTAECEYAAGRLVCRPVPDDAPFAPCQGLHFQALHHLNFLFICTLHWWKHYTWQEVSPNVRKFPFTVLCGVTAGVVVCRTVIDGAPFAPTQGLHFQALHLLSFLSTCTLHWCKHCTGLEASPNSRKFPFTALCGIAAGGVVCSA